MLHVYINYPNPHIMYHHDETCGYLPGPARPVARLVRVTPETIQAELARFRAGDYAFRAEAGLNGLWLQVDFGDSVFEEAVAAYLCRLLGKRYAPLASAEMRRHC